MEDAHISKFNIIPEVHIFGVFDGHGGKITKWRVVRYIVYFIFKL